MILYFERVEWNKKKLGALVDNASRLCVNCVPSIGFLKGHTLKHVLQWGMRSSDKIEIVYTTTPVDEKDIQDKDYAVVPRVFVEEDAQ